MLLVLLVKENVMVTVRTFQKDDRNILYISGYKALEAVLGAQLMGNA